MKYFFDGDRIVVTRDDFVDLQRSPAVFVLADSETGRKITKGGILALSLNELARLRAELATATKGFGW